MSTKLSYRERREEQEAQRAAEKKAWYDAKDEKAFLYDLYNLQGETLRAIRDIRGWVIFFGLLAVGALVLSTCNALLM
jgi:hypothetical protein